MTIQSVDQLPDMLDFFLPGEVEPYDGDLPDLYKFFYPEEFAGRDGLDALACKHVRRGFQKNKELHRKKLRPTVSYITCGPDPVDLAYKIVDNKAGNFVDADRVSAIIVEWIKSIYRTTDDEAKRNLVADALESPLNPERVQKLTRQVNAALILRGVLQMHAWESLEPIFVREKHIWNIKQPTRAEKEALLTLTRHSGSLPRNDRSFHGRNRKQCEDRGLPAMSVGYERSMAVRFA